MGLRIPALIFGAVALYSALTLNLYNLQIRKGDYYSARAASLFNSSGALASERGIIFFTDKSGSQVPVAINRDYPTIYADTREVEDARETLNRLAEVVKVPKGQLEKIFSKTNDPYEPIVRKAGESEITALKKDPIPGVNVDLESLRYYPFGKMAAHLLGYVSLDKSDADGVYGLEQHYNKTLKGAAGKIEDEGFVAPVHGADLHLTIDRNIQSQAEEIIKKVISDYRAESGSVIVQDPKTGAILAMASFPDFDPNSYKDYQIRNFLNPVTQSVYEPGSVFKIMTMAAGIDAGKITPDTVFHDTGSLTLNGRTIKNWDLKAHGRVTMTNIIEKSLNTGTAFAEKTMGHAVFTDYLTRFGFRETTGIDLPGEVKGSLGTLAGKNARDINFATASFGQGISVTPIQLLRAVSAIANGGMMMKPYVNADSKPARVGRVISEETSRKVVDMMVSSVNKNEIARINGYTVAGKTGTAQIPDFGHNGYTDDVINTYVGFAPAYDPKFAILVKLNKPAGAPLAGLTVVPAFRELAQFILNYYHVPPDNVKNGN